MTLHDHHAVQKREAMAYWPLSPRNRLVKVIARSRAVTSTASGYVTCMKFVAGQTLADTEQILGLNPGELAAGAHLLEFSTFPRAGQFELKGYSQLPDGKPWDSSSDYPVGRGAPQWRILPEHAQPCRLLQTVEPGGRFPPC